ncbi:hypothetical protein B566_EDAN004874 [Ephemera danica]|nr:hypothetical protein B566_EDAN004874 [Ephemera danica]
MHRGEYGDSRVMRCEPPDIYFCCESIAEANVDPPDTHLRVLDTSKSVEGPMTTTVPDVSLIEQPILPSVSIAPSTRQPLQVTSRCGNITSGYSIGKAEDKDWPTSVKNGSESPQSPLTLASHSDKNNTVQSQGKPTSFLMEQVRIASPQQVPPRASSPAFANPTSPLSTIVPHYVEPRSNIPQAYVSNATVANDDTLKLILNVVKSMEQNIFSMSTKLCSLDTKMSNLQMRFEERDSNINEMRSMLNKVVDYINVCNIRPSYQNQDTQTDFVDPEPSTNSNASSERASSSEEDRSTVISNSNENCSNSPNMAGNAKAFQHQNAMQQANTPPTSENGHEIETEVKEFIGATARLAFVQEGRQNIILTRSVQNDGVVQVAQEKYIHCMQQQQQNHLDCDIVDMSARFDALASKHLAAYGRSNPHKLRMGDLGLGSIQVHISLVIALTTT